MVARPTVNNYGVNKTYYCVCEQEEKGTRCKYKEKKM